jgi:hypothetical protein
VRFDVADPVVVATADQRRALGLDHWVDGTMGFHRAGGRRMAIAPNGPRLARHDLTTGGLLTGLVDPHQTIMGLPADVAHASGGPLHHDEGSGQLLLVYHGETFRNDDHRDFFSFIGMAVSDDDGATFEDLGRVITSDLVEDDPHRPGPVEIGSGGFVVRDGWFHLYFHDRNARYVRRDLCVARARLSDVLAAAQTRRAPVFAKLHDGAFREPGLGGRASELLPGLRHRVCWLDVAFLEPHDSFMLVYSTIEDVRCGQAMWNLAVALSPDGVQWGRPELLAQDAVAAETLYVTIDSGGSCQRTVTGDRFDIYRVRSTSKYRWDDAALERLTVSYGSRATDQQRVVAGGPGWTDR